MNIKRLKDKIVLIQSYWFILLFVFVYFMAFFSKLLEGDFNYVPMVFILFFLSLFYFIRKVTFTKEYIDIRSVFFNIPIKKIPVGIIKRFYIYQGANFRLQLYCDTLENERYYIGFTREDKLQYKKIFQEIVKKFRLKATIQSSRKYKSSVVLDSWWHYK